MATIAELEEASRRGILPQDKQALLDEARRRGLIGQDGQDAPKKSAFSVGTDAALRQVADNVMGIPSATGEMLATGAAGLETAGETMAAPLLGQEMNPVGRFQENRQQQRQQQPAAGLLALPNPEVSDIEAAGQTGVEGVQSLLGGEIPNVGQQFQEAQAEQEAQVARQRQEHPIATGAGEVAGDALTLATGRMPGAQALGRSSGLGRQAVKSLDNLPLGSRRGFEEAVSSPKMQKLMRGLRRTGETGAEGAVLAALDDGDPVKTGLFGAGAQAAGSSIFSAVDWAKRNPGGLAAAGMFAFGSAQLMDSAAPGIGDAVLENVDQAFNSVAGTLATAGAFGLAGAGRGRGRFIAKHWPRAAEAGTAFLRGNALSLLKRAQEEGESGPVRRTMGHLGTNPDSFSESQLNTLKRGFENNNVVETIDKLAEEDGSFRDIIQSEPQLPSAQGTLTEAVSTDVKEAELPKASKAALSAARKLPQNSGLRKQFEEGGPRTFISQVFKSDEAGTVVKKLSGKPKRDVLEVELRDLIAKSMRETENGQKALDPKGLQKRWNSLGDIQKAFDQKTRNAVSAFIDNAQRAGESLFTVPDHLAHSLMKEGGTLRSRLLGIQEKESDNGE